MTSTISLIGIALAFLHSVTAVPAPTITQAPTKASELAARQAIDNFGTEVVTATISSTVTTFTHTYGLALLNNAADDEVIELSDPMLSLMNSVVSDTSICPTSASTPAPQSKRRRRQDVDEVLAKKYGIDKRTPAPGVIDTLDADDCTVPIAQWIIDNMEPDNALNQLVVYQGEAAGARDLAGVSGDLAEIVEELNNRADLAENIAWVRVVRRRNLVSNIIALVIAFRRYQILRTAVIGVSNYVNNPDNSRSCGVDEEAPACPDFNCKGDNGQCTVEVNSGCICYEFQIIPDASYPYDSNRLDQQQTLLAQWGPPNFSNNPPKCLGLGSPHYITRDVGSRAVDSFCSSTAGISGDMDKVFNPNTNDAVELSINFQKSFAMRPIDCQFLFQNILDGCDGDNPDNPLNFKHGGTIPHPSGATLSLNPKSGTNPYCNGFLNKKWVDVLTGVDAATQFCNSQNLVGHAGDRHTVTYNKGSTIQITLTLSFYQDYTLAVGDCISQFRVPLDGCDGNQPVTNPDDNKYGGSFTNPEGVVFIVTPDVEPPIFPPDEIDPNGHQITPTCASGDRAVWPPPDEMTRAINEYCVDAAHFTTGDHSWRSGYFQLHLHISAFAVDASKVYQQGSPVCRYTGPWHGVIIENDCKFALNAMANQCNTNAGFHNATYDYNCVEWSVGTNYF